MLVLLDFLYCLSLSLLPSRWATLQSLIGLDGAHETGSIVAVPGHRDVLVGEAAWAMRRPVNIDGPNPLRRGRVRVSFSSESLFLCL